MRAYGVILIIVMGMFMFGCGGNNDGVNSVKVISATEGESMIKNESDIIILDVRTEPEYESGHIKGAVLLPLDEISKRAQEVLKDKNKKILIYCRSGSRSNRAAKLLVDMGYNNVYDFGGIIDYKGEIEK
ncbi:Rhodanese-related sulfurtransferase [Hathewaya proteolytica DSM 3090]|uniref:Rhodanese-related sulfurtransferase n=1 Tax=Hathewaya proteolytica DSM 3090 TaxID=1121331 RepID=A0A1M6NVV8_9CLOT|nr:rhodanese-like domain-containing protein [Hathewaya proteolytica]SHJ99823.1 Rhodanese-related sulfurtransferase [Hathewaya proteolytica DSM 3090]